MFEVTCTIIESGKVVITPFATAESLHDHITQVVTPNVLSGIIVHNSTVWKD